MIEEIAYGTDLYDRMLAFRDEQLRRPLGLRLTAADTNGEDWQIHIAAVEDGQVLGTVCLKPIDATHLKLRQMAVAPEQRGTGLGSDLVRFGEALAVSRGFDHVELHARMTARGFYERLGYAVTGEPFDEIGVEHVGMGKILRGLTAARTCP